MSKWLDVKNFEKFQEEKKQEKDEYQQSGSYALKFRPVMGTVKKAMEYEIRFLPDSNKKFYVKYLYHMFKVGERFRFFLCPKTHDMDSYCPWCHAAQTLWNSGDKADKARARIYNRKERFTGNVYVVDDPRDASISDEKDKMSGKVCLYEFPKTIESKLKKEITDTKKGYGISIFDPEDGPSFFLSIGAKTPDGDGNVWPDYGDSMFGRETSPIKDNQNDIELIMAQVYSLDEFLSSLEISWDEHKKLLKAEMVWNDVEDAFEKATGTKKKEESEKRKTALEQMDDVPFGKDEDEKSEEKEDEEDSDEDILSQLKGL